jgi:phosphosulfolactate synthase
MAANMTATAPRHGRTHMIDFLTLPERTTKPRESGITHVLDKGYSLDQVRDFLAAAKGYVDIVKLGWGTAVVTPNLKEKIDLYQSNGVPVCFGGTLFEVCLRQNKLEEYLQTVRDLGMDHIEVSDGTVAMDEVDKIAILRRLSKEFRVLSEVGSKDAEVVIAPYKWVESIKRELEAGAWKVVTEGRESGTVGIYQPGGEVKEGLLEEIVTAVDAENLLFEAPVKSQQTWFIKQFGANVNLGNILPEEVISVETLRLGVRGDTLLQFH